MNSLINIIIVDDNPAFLDGLASLITSESNFNLLARFTSGSELFRYPDLRKADLILMDIEMPGLSGIETAIRVNFRYPNIQMIAITMYQDAIYLQQLVESGFMGFVGKNEVAEKLFSVIKTVHERKFTFPHDMRI